MLSELFEVAIVVETLALAIEGELAPFSAAEPMTSRLTLWTPDAVADVELLISYTRTGPIRFEVIEMVPDSLWGTPGVHHYGWFSDDLAEDSRALVARGMPLVATRAGGPELPWQFTYHDCPPFGLIELVDVRMQPFLEGWWEDGHPPLALYPQTTADTSRE